MTTSEQDRQIEKMINTINSAEFDMDESDIRFRVSRLWSLMCRTGVIKMKEKEHNVDIQYGLVLFYYTK